MRTKRKLNLLREIDVYSLLLFVFYKLKDSSEYSTLSELAYVLDKDDLLKFMKVFGGTTIRVPTIKEFQLIVDALLLYQYVDINDIELDKAIKLVDTTENCKVKDIRKVYYTLKNVLENYDFHKEGLV